MPPAGVVATPETTPRAPIGAGRAALPRQARAEVTLLGPGVVVRVPVLGRAAQQERRRTPVAAAPLLLRPHAAAPHGRPQRGPAPGAPQTAVPAEDAVAAVGPLGQAPDVGAARQGATGPVAQGLEADARGPRQRTAAEGEPQGALERRGLFRVAVAAAVAALRVALAHLRR